MGGRAKELEGARTMAGPNVRRKLGTGALGVHTHGMLARPPRRISASTAARNRVRVAAVVLAVVVGCDPRSGERDPPLALPSGAPSLVPPAAPVALASQAAPSTLPTRPAPSEAPSAGGKDDARLRVLVTGDVIAHRPVLVGEGVLARALEPLGPLFLRADAVIVNHEASTGDAPRGKAHELVYAAPPFWAEELSRSHVTALSLANNHACDLGPAGLLATVARAKESHLAVVGAGDAPWKAQVVASRGGHDVCAIAWSTLTNVDPAACSKSLAFASESPAALKRFKAEISTAKKRGCGAVVAVVHMGEEYEAQRPSVQALGAVLAEAGADAVVMHHPHVPSPVVTTTTSDGRKVPIFTSLGNLVSNQGYAWRTTRPVFLPNRKEVSTNAWTRLGLIADLGFSWPDPAGRPVVTFGYHVVFDERPKLEKQGPEELLARLVTRDDHALVDSFAKDQAGPNTIFRSGCWRRDSATAPTDATCADDGVRPSAPRTARKPTHPR